MTFARFVETQMLNTVIVEDESKQMILINNETRAWDLLKQQTTS